MKKKTFFNLTKDDSVYYWDKGKIHAQKISHIEDIEEMCEGDTFQTRKIYLKNRAVSCPIEVMRYPRCWYDEWSDYRIWHGTFKYSCIEALQKWLEMRTKWCERRLKKYQERCEQLSGLIEKYDNALDEYGRKD